MSLIDEMNAENLELLLLDPSLSIPLDFPLHGTSTLSDS